MGRVDVSFTIEQRRATVVWLSVGERRPGDGDYSFSRSLSARIAEPPTPQLAGYCAVTAGNALAVFDKHGRQVGAVLPTGRGPLALALDPIRGRLYAALNRDEQLEFIDTTSRVVVARVPLRAGDAPRDMALVRGGTLLLVVNEDSNSVSIIDVDAAAEVGRIPVGQQPWSVVVDRAGARAYVLSRRANSITALDAVTRVAVGSAATEPEPVWAAIDWSGTRLYVVHHGSLYMAIYTLPSLVLERQVFVGAPASFVKVDPRSDLVYVALANEPRIQVFDPLSLVPLTAVDVSSPISYMAIDDVENTMYMVMPRLRSVAVLDLHEQDGAGILRYRRGAARGVAAGRAPLAV